jgi:hypothetical protein
MKRQQRSSTVFALLMMCYAGSAMAQSSGNIMLVVPPQFFGNTASASVDKTWTPVGSYLSSQDCEQAKTTLNVSISRSDGSHEIKPVPAESVCIATEAFQSIAVAQPTAAATQ